jgi:Protein of unknown function (DUF3168)
MAEADIIGALVALLKADAAVAILAGDDVYGIELPQEAVKRMPRNMLVIQPSGGVSLTAGSDVQADTQRVDVFAYGATPREANSLRNVAKTVLLRTRRKLISRVLIHWINSGGGFFAARERDGQWPQSFQSFQIFHATQEV